MRASIACTVVEEGGIDPCGHRSLYGFHGFADAVVDVVCRQGHDPLSRCTHQFFSERELQARRTTDLTALGQLPLLRSQKGVGLWVRDMIEVVPSYAVDFPMGTT